MTIGTCLSNFCAKWRKIEQALQANEANVANLPSASRTSSKRLLESGVECGWLEINAAPGWLWQKNRLPILGLHLYARKAWRIRIIHRSLGVFEWLTPD